ncbi:hypothetical protein ER308_10765 [Egibacter rhizosphaerae]|uniref:Uncharacterized protein n=1 Tax=Egibacter rhizosphaerae TaxID=1670831 RepID=A0A411YFG9_9ACTN|nr:hypothetical protein [Egibacter rhizosphaerae]QBI19993.1 hypothetical protein ER308_10765 [Egibacter rhizosphaerae]
MNEPTAGTRFGGWLGDRPASKGAVARAVALVVVIVALGLAHVPPALFQGPMLVTAWTVEGPEAIHQLHGLFNGVWVVMLYVPLLALLYRPAPRPAVAVFVAAVVAAGVLRVLASPVILADAGPGPLVVAGVLTIALLALVPGLRGAFRPMGRLDPILGGIGSAGVLLAVLYAVQQSVIWLQLSATDPHTQLAHWTLMALTGLLAAFGVALGAARLPGGRLPLWLGAMAAAYLGVASLVMPGQASALPLWAALGVLVLSAAAVVRFEMLAFGAARGVATPPAPQPRPGPAVAGG